MDLSHRAAERRRRAEPARQALADLPEVIGFFSYSREDDESSEGRLSALRDAIHRELSAQLGRSGTSFRLWQDQVAIAPGQLWEVEIKTAVEQAVFFIPIVTPRAVNSQFCKFEFETFLAREHALGRSDLVFPLLYINVPALGNEAQWRKDPVLSIVGARQYVDWRRLRHLDIRETEVRQAIERFCDKITEALRKPWVSQEEQRRAEAAGQAEEETQRTEAARLPETEKVRSDAGLRADDLRTRVRAVMVLGRQMQEKVDTFPARATRLALQNLLRHERDPAVRVSITNALAEDEKQRAEARVRNNESEAAWSRDGITRATLPGPEFELDPLIISELSEHFAGQKGVYVHPDIPPKMQTNARNALGVPRGEFVWILFDYTLFGSATDCLLAGRHAIFHRQNSWTSPVAISYADLKSAVIVDTTFGLKVGEVDMGFGGGNVTASRDFLRSLQSRLTVSR